MKTLLLLLLIFLSPSALMAQQLECCESKKEVETFLSGNWKIMYSSLNQNYRYKFTEGRGKFWIYKFNGNGEVTEIDSVKQTLEVFKTSDGFKIDYSNGQRLVNSKIKMLDSVYLVLDRGDGRENWFVRISD